MVKEMNQIIEAVHVGMMTGIFMYILLLLSRPSCCVSILLHQKCPIGIFSHVL